MRHGKAGKKLNRSAAHRKALFRNMVTSLLQYERIVTTEVKAKEVGRLGEKMITLGKRGDLHARRLAISFIRSDEVVKKLFSELAERYRSREGGYTRVIKLEQRKGDNSPMGIVELVDRPIKEKEETKKGKKSEAKAKPEAAEKKASEKAPAKKKAEGARKAGTGKAATKKAKAAEPKKEAGKAAKTTKKPKEPKASA